MNFLSWIKKELFASLGNPKTTTMAIVCLLSWLAPHVGVELPADLNDTIFKLCAVIGVFFARDQRTGNDTASPTKGSGSATGNGFPFATQAALASVLLVMFAVAALAQPILPGALPPVQIATVNEAVSGNEFTAYVWNQPKTRAVQNGTLTRCRLAGVETVGASGSVTTILANAAQSALHEQIKNQAVLLKPIGSEPYFTWDETAQPKPNWIKNERLIAQAWLVEWDADDRTFLGADLTQSQLERGWVWLGKGALTELSHVEYEHFSAIQKTAQTQQKGVWFYGVEPWVPAPVVPARPATPPLEMPKRS